jgi:hypothetical protein
MREARAWISVLALWGVLAAAPVLGAEKHPWAVSAQIRALFV